MQPIIDGIISGIYQTTALEWIAVSTGLMSVWFSMKENILVYPTGIISVLIYIYLTFQTKLYADAGVNSYYFVMSIYGWYHWKNTGDDRDQIPITKNNRKEWIISAGILVSSFILLFFALSTFTDSDVPFWDATTTCFAITGMWLMAQKKLEHWIMWIITDLISIPLYFYKGWVLTSFQFLFFTALAIAGYIAWKKSINNTQSIKSESALE
ncbi:MAG: nicotinamide riboside transporter PnuC [Balneolaceae bacterium]